MSKLHEIPVVVVGPGIAANPEGRSRETVVALLVELEAKLAAFFESGEPATMDLKWLISAPETLGALDLALGCGEVEAEISCNGGSRIRETAIPCAWRISHHDPEGRSIGEFLEVTEIPLLLRADRLMIPRGMAILRANIASAAQFLTRPEASNPVHP